jgi:hypothetical protein
MLIKIPAATTKEAVKSFACLARSIHHQKEKKNMFKFFDIALKAADIATWFIHETPGIQTGEEKKGAAIDIIYTLLNKRGITEKIDTSILNFFIELGVLSHKLDAEIFINNITENNKKYKIIKLKIPIDQ